MQFTHAISIKLFLDSFLLNVLGLPNQSLGPTQGCDQDLFSQDRDQDQDLSWQDRDQDQDPSWQDRDQDHDLS